MLTFDIEQFMFELKDGAVKNVGSSNKQATIKMYDVEGVDVREYGDKRVKLAFEDAQGSEIEVALFPEQVTAVTEGLELLDSDDERQD